MRITVIRRNRDYMAHLSDDASVWESGSTQAEAVDKLLISLCGGWLDIIIAWLPPTEPKQ